MEHQEIHGTYPEPWLVPHSARWLYRALLGRPMDNVVRTDATFFHSATKGYPSRWLRLPGWQRATTRLLSVILLLLVSTLLAAYFLGAHAWVLRIALRLLEISAAISVVISVPLCLRRYGLRLHLPMRTEILQETESGEKISWKWEWEMREIFAGRLRWEREMLLPLAAALSPILQVHRYPGEVRKWISVSRDLTAEILLPQSFSATGDRERTRVEKAVAGKLALLEWSASWQLSGSAPRLLVSPLPSPPKVALYGDFLRMLEMTEEYRPFLGVIAGGELLSAEMVEASPHIALSAGSGAGKSMLMKAVIMQALRWGWAVIVLDWKAESHSWAKGLPGVRYVTTVEGIHDMGVVIGQEVDKRKENPGAPFPRVLVVREEWNMTASLLMNYWNTMRDTAEPAEKRLMPRRSPALMGFESLDFAGRQFGLFDFLAAQRMSNRVFNGNVDLRENFMIKLLARYTMQTWKMLVADVKFIRKPRQLGSWVVISGDEATIIQGILITDQEAREFATGGEENPRSPWALASYPQHPSQARTQGKSLPGGVATGSQELDPVVDISLEWEEAEPIEVDARKLSEMVDALIPLGVTYKILQHARDDREPGFPEPYGGSVNKGYTYDFVAVYTWARKRHASIRATGENG